MKLKLNAEYSGIFATYWMYYGVVASFCSVFLLAKGYTNSEIGIILAVASAVSVFMQPLLGDWADRSKKLTVIGVSEVGTVILLVLTVGLYIFQRKSVALWVLYVMIMAWELALQPLFNSLCFKLQESGYHINFGICRGGGSLGYAILTAILGTLVENHGVMVIPTTGLIMLAALLTILWLTERSFKKACAERKSAGKSVASGAGQASDAGQACGEGQANADAVEMSEPTVETVEEYEEINLIDFMKRNTLFVVLAIAVVVMYFQNAATNNFMLQIVEGIGGNAEDMGRIFAVMAAAEIPGLFFFDNLQKKFGTRPLLTFAAIMFILKLALMWLAESLFLMYVSQVLNMVSFAIFLPSMVAFINEIMERGEAVKGQALFTAATAISGIFASVFGGIILDVSGPKFLLFITVILTAIGAVAVSLLAAKIEKTYKNRAH